MEPGCQGSLRRVLPLTHLSLRQATFEGIARPQDLPKAPEARSKKENPRTPVFLTIQQGGNCPRGRKMWGVRFFRSPSPKRGQFFFVSIPQKGTKVIFFLGPPFEWVGLHPRKGAKLYCFFWASIPQKGPLIQCCREADSGPSATWGPPKQATWPAIQAP
jgi:hypothetical protein